MLTFSDFSKRLAHSQLKNTAAVDTDIDRGIIAPEFMDTIVDLTNQGLTDISTKLILVKKQVDLIFISDVKEYQLISTGVGTYLNIDETDSFQDDLIKILEIIDEDGENHPHDTNGHIVTSTYDTLRFTKSKIKELGEKIRITYQAKHAKVTVNDIIHIPPNLETALQLFVGSLYLSHMNGEEHSSKGDSYFAAYLRHMGEDTHNNNSSTSEVDSDTRFLDTGFV